MSKVYQTEINQLRSADTKIMQVVEKLDGRDLAGIASNLKIISDELSEFIEDAEAES